MWTTPGCTSTPRLGRRAMAYAPSSSEKTYCTSRTDTALLIRFFPPHYHHRNPCQTGRQEPAALHWVSPIYSLSILFAYVYAASAPPSRQAIRRADRPVLPVLEA